ncbi:hypothetical protein FB45DRAFT_930645 [Roridomyces roridus]|uniref:Golgi apparatus membrane protein TVP38 n=1 Tax=Roridomyces roridus TaxID=1738132 RepID=A0AAD7FGU6_9AGAR|nr:hypothetical protein FB45DRAFT_930645 [Roridomyces roridus]
MSTHLAAPKPTYYSMPVYASSDETAPKPEISRTPSPTPSEQEILSRKNTIKEWFSAKSRKEWLKIVLVLVVVVAVIILIEAFHDKIINALKPVSNWLHGLRAGWLIPIAVLIVLSIPPFFGQEILYLLVGLVWGLGPGFGIAAAGTILGEIGTYFIFKSCCRARGQKMELSNLQYGTLARVVREGGLRIAIIIRYSSIPPHLTTAIFSTCGMPFWIFLVAAVVSLPKQLAIVYVGVALESDSKKSSHVQKGVIAVTAVVTVLSFFYIRRLMIAARPAYIYSRRKARQAKMQEIP